MDIVRSLPVIAIANTIVTGTEAMEIGIDCTATAQRAALKRCK